MSVLLALNTMALEMGAISVRNLVVALTSSLVIEQARKKVRS
jgi:hypothetical protein